MAFQKAIIRELYQMRDSASVVTGIRFLVEMRDTVIPDTQNCLYLINGEEFALLPAGAAARRAALIAIIKRETRKCYDAWVASQLTKPKPPLVRDPATDLGITEITSLNGA